MDELEILRINELKKHTKLLEEMRNDNAKKSGMQIQAEMIKGDKGDSPIKGVDYYTNEEVEQIKKEVTPVKGVDYVDGIDGHNPLTVSDVEPLNPQIGDLWYKN